jgi:hypothetical protein
VNKAGLAARDPRDPVFADLEARGADPKLPTGRPSAVANAIVSFEVVGVVDLVDACARVRPGEYRKRVGVIGLRPFAGRRR